MINIQSIKTETRNAKTTYIDELPITDIMTLINEEDAVVPLALSKALPALSKTAEYIASAFTEGGRLIYIGAGTSGRIGVLDASECPPTYGTDPSQVVGIIAGGNNALTDALEGAEDDEQAGRQDIQTISISNKDVLVALAASGRTPYTLAAMKAAKETGALTASIVCSPHSPMAQEADIPIELLVGPEVITGSTRMKAGTAQKLAVNMLSTASMIKSGKVYGNLMVDVQPTNEKLKERALLIVMEASGTGRTEAEEALEQQNHSTKAAIFQLITGETGEVPQKTIHAYNGKLKAALQSYLNEN